MSEKTSIIIPIYNVDLYVTNCLKSVFNQIELEYEVIGIDDGASDHSSEICDEYALIHENCIVVHKENGGLSSARNTGIEVSSGEYIGFIDSDDTINADYYKILLEVMREYNVEICKSEFLDVFDSVIPDSSIHYSYLDEITIMSNVQYIKQMCEYKASCSFCDKLFRRELLFKYRFLEGRLNEDLLLLSRMLMENDLKLANIPYASYHYFQRPKSITKVRFSQATVNSVLNCMELIEYAKNHKSEVEIWLRILCLFQIRTFLIQMPYDYIHTENIDYFRCRVFLKENIKLVSKAFFSIKDKLFLLLFNLAPRVTKRIIGLYNKNYG